MAKGFWEKKMAWGSQRFLKHRKPKSVTLDGVSVSVGDWVLYRLGVVLIQQIKGGDITILDISPLRYVGLHLQEKTLSMTRNNLNLAIRFSQLFIEVKLHETRGEICDAIADDLTAMWINACTGPKEDAFGVFLDADSYCCKAKAASGSTLVMTGEKQAPVYIQRVGRGIRFS